MLELPSLYVYKNDAGSDELLVLVAHLFFQFSVLVFPDLLATFFNHTAHSFSPPAT
jgi:hypothetical protein